MLLVQSEGTNYIPQGARPAHSAAFVIVGWAWRLPGVQYSHVHS